MTETGDYLWRRFHHRDPDELRAAGLAAQRSGVQVHEDMVHLQERVEMLTLVSRALWELLEKKTGLEERDLVAKVAEIDLRDGQLDHQLQSPVFDCPSCGKKVNARTRMCVYCGFKDFPIDVFNAV